MHALLRLYLVVAVMLPIVCRGSGLESALRYLEEEVPRWKRENGCHSCHNNGDGARALLIAKSIGFRVKEEALADSLEWLNSPSKWEPKALARVQFTAALVAALNTALATDRKPLLEAAALLAADQSANGSWQVETEGTVGSAATYGPALATYLAREALEFSGEAAYKQAVAKADAWLAALKPETPLDAAAHYLATRAPGSLDLLLRSQNANGSWLHEGFDTAVAILALAKVPLTPETSDRIARGRAWLLKSQFGAGGWPGTTRPSGGASYAQHISTSAWVAIALARTQPLP